MFIGCGSPCNYVCHEDEVLRERENASALEYFNSALEASTSYYTTEKKTLRSSEIPTSAYDNTFTVGVVL